MTAKELASNLYNEFYDVSSDPHCVKVRHNIAIKDALDFILEVQQELNKKTKIHLNEDGEWIRVYQNKNKDEE